MSPNDRVDAACLLTIEWTLHMSPNDIVDAARLLTI